MSDFWAAGKSPGSLPGIKGLKLTLAVTPYTSLVVMPSVSRHLPKEPVLLDKTCIVWTIPLIVYISTLVP
jgi:hypothetical protein